MKYFLLLMTLVLGSQLAYASDIIGLPSSEEKVLQRCNELAHRYWDTGVTAKMREGNTEYQKCLLGAIREHLLIIMKNKEQAKAVSEKLEKGVSLLLEANFELETNNKWCKPLDCGTLYSVTYASFGSKILEDFLKNIEYTRQEYE